MKQTLPASIARLIPQVDTIILANGAFPTGGLAKTLLDLWASGEYSTRLIACDGATNKLDAYTQRAPEVIVGDLDSITPDLRARYADRLVHFSGQDDNDLTKAMRYAYETGGGRSHVAILGASGGREDHAIGNLALLTSYTPWVSTLAMFTDYGCFRLIEGEAELQVEIGKQISVFNFGDARITLRGVRWPLENALLPHLWQGTLNRADEPRVYLNTTAPILLYLADECK